MDASTLLEPTTLGDVRAMIGRDVDAGTAPLYGGRIASALFGPDSPCGPVEAYQQLRERARGAVPTLIQDDKRYLLQAASLIEMVCPEVRRGRPGDPAGAGCYCPDDCVCRSAAVSFGYEAPWCGCRGH